MKHLLLLTLLLPSLLMAKSKVPAKQEMAGYIMVYHKDQDHGLHMAISHFFTYHPIGYFDAQDCPMKRTNFSEQKHGAVTYLTEAEMLQLEKYWKLKY